MFTTTKNDSESENIENCSSPIEPIFVPDDNSADDPTGRKDVMDLDMDTSSENVGVELVSREELVTEEPTKSADQLQLYNCEICHDSFTSCGDLFSHKMSCYLEPDKSKTEAVKNQDVISNELEIKSSEKLSHLVSEIKTVSNDPGEKIGTDQDENLGSINQEKSFRVDEENPTSSNDPLEEADIDQGEISSSVSHESPFRVSEANNEPSTPLNDPVEEADADQNEISGSMSCESPLRVSEPNNETSKPSNDPVKETDADQVEIPDSVSCESPFRVAEPDNEMSNPLDNSVEKTDTDQNEISDSMSYICEAENESAKSDDPVNETETDQKSNSCSMSYESPLRVSEPNNETSKPFNNPAEEPDADQVEISDSVSCESPLRVSDPNDETSKPLNNSVKETDADQVEIPDSVSSESPLRVSEPNNEPSTPLSDPVKEADADQNGIPDLVTCESPVRVSEPNNETSKLPNNSVNETDADQVEIPDSVSCESPLRVSEPDNKTSTPLNSLIKKTDTDQKEISVSMGYFCEAVYDPPKSNETDQKVNPCSMSYESPQHTNEIDYESSTSANEAGTDHSIDYDPPSDDDQIDSKLGIAKIEILHPNDTESDSFDELQTEIIYIDQSPLQICDVEDDPSTINWDHSYCTESNSASESTKTHRNHTTASFTNDNSVHSNDDLDSTEDFEEISIEIDLDEIPVTQDYSSHTEKSHPPRKLFRCDKCDRNFSNRRGLRVHNRVAPRCEGSFKCKQCDYRGRYLHNLKYHIATEHKRGLFTCETCGKVCNNKISLQSHLRFVHSNKKIIRKNPTKTESQYVCDYCQKSFLFKGNLQKHIVNHIYAHKCDQCDRSLPTETALILHKRSHSSIYWLKCEKCHFTADIRKKINDHMLQVHGTEGSVICDTCGVSFKNKLSLLEHRRRVHLGKQPRRRRRFIPNQFGAFVCEYCQKSFDAKNSLVEHIKSEHEDREVVCELCGKSCKNIQSLRNHHKNTHIKPFKCEICDFRGQSKYHLLAHFRSHIGEKPFACDICDKSFMVKRGLELHQLSHTNISRYICDHCQQGFWTKIALRDHIISIHLHPRIDNSKQSVFRKKIKTTCDLCLNIFSSKKGMREHLKRVHKVIDEFICDHCQQKFRFKVALEKHILSTHVLIFKCDKCSKRYSSEIELNFHKIAHTVDGKIVIPKRYVCENCGKACSTRHNLSAHQRTHSLTRQRTPVRKSSDVFTCEVCGRKCSTRHHLSAHQRTHSRTRRRTPVQKSSGVFTCEVCGKTFPTADHLSNHRCFHSYARQYTPPDQKYPKLFTCEICGHETRTMRSLRSHFRVIHIGERPFICELCEKSFSTKSDLTDHVQDVHRDPMFHCDYCQVGFRAQTALREHIRLSHQTFTCEICDFSCADLSYLTDHFRVHTGEKPYACEKCNQRFSTRATLTTHVHTWHRVIPTIPNIIEVTLD